jgi:predicted metalloprotease
MRMDGQEESSNVEDVRGSGGGGGGGGMGFMGGRGIGLGTIAIALVGGWIFGINPLTLLGMLSGGGGTQSFQTAPAPAPRNPSSQTEEPEVKFVRQVLGSTEQVWTAVFRQANKTYQPPRLRLFSGSYPTACGQGQAAMGPFYCPADRIVYLDMSFFNVLSQRLGAPGQFAQAYVVAHEVGHHVQNLLGISDKVDAARQRGSEAQANAMSVRLELQADCFAGVWAKLSQAQQGWRLEQGDIETALNAASQIGDDTLQRKARGTVVPETFTHGTSAQRVGWFKRGFGSGSPDQCNTFGASQL